MPNTSKQELLKVFFPNGDTSKRLTQKTELWSTYKYSIVLLTKFLPENTTLKLRMYYLVNNIQAPVLCKKDDCDNLEIFDENLTEYQNMLNNGYDRIWDCGNYKYKYKIG